MKRDALRRLVRWGVVGVGASVVASVSCARGPNGPGGRVSLLDPTGLGAAYQSPAVWRYHPPREAPLGARLDLPGSSILLAGDRGERWLASSKTGEVVAAARLAPERLVAIIQRGSEFAFVGQSGTSYESASPLGPFLRSSAPLDRLAKVEAAAGIIVGITARGALVQSGDGGAVWQPVGAEGGRFVDVALGPGGAGLALAVPESLYATQDRGSSWQKLDIAPFGALRLSADGKSGIAVDSALGPRRWDPTSKAVLSPMAAMPARHRFQLTRPPPRGPDASALEQHRAVVVAGEYLEIAQSGERSQPGWLLWRGRFDGALTSSPLELAKGCSAVRLAAFGDSLALLCATRSLGAQQELTLHLSDDRGKSWAKDAEPIVGRMAELSLVVARGGQVALSGVCPPSARARGCSPFGVYYRRKAERDAGARGKLAQAVREVRAATDATTEEPPAEAEHELGLAATPSLERTASALAVSSDGAAIYALGKRTKGTAYGIYVSRDGGRSYESNDIPELEAAPSYDDDDDEYGGRFARPASRSAASSVPLQMSAADDGTISVVFRQGGRLVLALADADGRLVQLTRPPVEVALLGAYGSRALGVASGSGRAWESLDGGATWDPIGKVPVDPCPGGGGCEAIVHCAAPGCVVGSELSRVGWRGQADDDHGVLSPPEDTRLALSDRRVRTALSCSLSEGGWQPLVDVGAAPTAATAALGKAAWFAVASAPQTASARVVRALLGSKGKLEAQVLLPPAARPAQHALYASTQIEGAAALRYLTPEASKQSRLTNVEVVWENLLEGRTYRAKIADGGAYSPGDHTPGSGAETAHVDLLSITAGGLYLRLHRSPRDDQPTYFLDGRAVTTVPPVSWPATSLSTRVTEMVHAGSGKHVPVRLYEDGAVVIAGRATGSSYSFEAMTASVPRAKDFGLSLTRDLTYLNGAPGLALLLFDPQGSERRNQFFPFASAGAALGQAVELPTQLDLADPPKRCSAVARKDQPRVVVPFQAGSRHPILVQDAVEPMRLLLSARAVLHGSPADPCLAALDADPIVLDPDDDTARVERAIVLLDDLENSWLFRSSPAAGRSRVEARAMSCRFDPSAEVPFEVYSAPGTQIRRGN